MPRPAPLVAPATTAMRPRKASRSGCQFVMSIPPSVFRPQPSSLLRMRPTIAFATELAHIVTESGADPVRIAEKTFLTIKIRLDTNGGAPKGTALVFGKSPAGVASRERLFERPSRLLLRLS